MSPERRNPPPGLAGDGLCLQADEEVTEACALAGNSATCTSGPRQEGLKILEWMIGAPAITRWLKGSQPAFDGRTGGDMLQRDPKRLLRHLKLLADSVEDDGDIDPLLIDRPIARRREKDGNRVLSILDEIFPGGVTP